MSKQGDWYFVMGTRTEGGAFKDRKCDYTGRRIRKGENFWRIEVLGPEGPPVIKFLRLGDRWLPDADEFSRIYEDMT